MGHSSLGLGRRHWAAIFFGAGALAIGACSSPSTGPWLGTAASSSHASHARALTEPTVAFSFQPVSDTGIHNEVTGVNDESQIVGVYKKAGQYSSFTAQCAKPLYYIDCSKATFAPATYEPGPADGTYLNANDNTNPDSYDAGYVSSPPPQSTGYVYPCTTCGVLYDERTLHWLTPLLQAPKEGTVNCAVTELLGINNAKVAVGFYESPTTANTSGCKTQAFEEYLFNGRPVFVNFNVPMASSSIATGIDNGGNVVGTAIVNGSNGSVLEGWYYHDFNYTTFYVDNSSTQPTGINWAGGIVGNYTNSGVTHGFLITTDKKHQITPTPEPPYATIDNGSYGTFVNSIEPSYWIISGWYQSDSSGGIQGFVGTCTGGCTPSPLSDSSGSKSRGRAKPRTGPTWPAGSRP
jgi:hypothetical protein